jgi:alkylation response protein AidB-like acyl-CoA dehydrogenase
MAAPTILAFGTRGQNERYLRPLWTGEEVWCQLFSEPGGGVRPCQRLDPSCSLTATVGLSTAKRCGPRAPHLARFAILLARTDPDLPKHQGLTYFLCDMTGPGVDVRPPLRQITGEAEFNEVFLSEVRIPDSQRLGAIRNGWRVANATLNNECVSIGQTALREAGMVGVVAQTWRRHPDKRTPELHDRLVRLWVEAEVSRLTGIRLAQKLSRGHRGRRAQ